MAKITIQLPNGISSETQIISGERPKLLVVDKILEAIKYGGFDPFTGRYSTKTFIENDIKASIQFTLTKKEKEKIVEVYNAQKEKEKFQDKIQDLIEEYKNLLGSEILIKVLDSKIEELQPQKSINRIPRKPTEYP